MVGQQNAQSVHVKQSDPQEDSNFTFSLIGCSFWLVWPPPLQSLAVKKNFFFVQILGGEKLSKFGEKWAVKHF